MCLLITLFFFLVRLLILDAPPYFLVQIYLLSWSCGRVGGQPAKMTASRAQAEEQMEVQAAVGMEAKEAAALGTKSRGGLGRVREHPQARGRNLSLRRWTYSAAGGLRKVCRTSEMFISWFRIMVKGQNEVCLLFRDVLCKRRKRKRKRFQVFQWALCSSHAPILLFPLQRRKQLSMKLKSLHLCHISQRHTTIHTHFPLF